ncbi:MAG: UDP-N-acetylglucosamine 2-epimerase (non-hydrolyzing) [Proteobacteria bacterium]|nr:UDP-N-acetylglucosamine 2-epimerase (non-hydrolyzing) [Pseudomonadota bacterium]
MVIHLIAAARPNFMKIAPLYHALGKEAWAHPVIVHTGQHYDLNMSDVFFRDFGLPEPDIHLNVGSGTHAEQTGKVMIAYEKVIMKEKPDLVIVVGDVNSTAAATLAAVKLGVKVAHLEAGLRSFDRTMPEEINRLVTDAIADILWTPSPDGDENLLKEGVSKDKIHRVGNIMIDSLVMMKDRIESETLFESLNVSKGGFGLVTLHRPANVDHPENLKKICEILLNIAAKLPIVFPVHPRTLKNLEKTKQMDSLQAEPNIMLMEPLSYVRFMNLVFNSKFLLTDSGGVQEETTYLGIPCLTLRPNTERPVTITQGTNSLCTTDDVEMMADEIVSGKYKKGTVPELWDGQTAARIVKNIVAMFH